LVSYIVCVILRVQAALIMTLAGPKREGTMGWSLLVIVTETVMLGTALALFAGVVLYLNG
jgi:hypothetical protein